MHANAALVCDGGSIIAEPGGEVIVQPGGIYVVCGTHEFLGPGACISTTGGTIQIPDEATLRVNNSGLLASFAPGTIELGNNATVIIESDGKLVWNANTNWTFGSNARVEIHGTVKVADGVTLNLPDNSQVYVYEGATFELGSGATISTTGKFHAIGSVESPVQFVKSPTAGENWQGITAMSGLLNGDLRLEHVAFENAVKAIHVETPLIAEIHSTSITNGGIGIEVVPNGGMGPGGPAPPTMVIENTTITNTPLGIVVDNFSDLLIDGCHLSLSEQGEEASRGISLVNSSPTILATTIEGFSKGIQGLSYSMPLLQNLVGGSGGYSIIQSNGVGAHFESESNAILGYDGDGGQNSFIANVNLHVVLRDKSIVYAIRNYWGAEEPDPRLFDVEEGSEFYYVPYLNSPPEGGAPFVESNGGDKGEDPSMNPTSPLVRLAIQMRLQGRYSEAMQTLKGIIRDPIEPQTSKRWAIGHLLAMTQMMSNASLSGYLDSLQVTHPQFGRLLASMLPSAYLHERRTSNAVAAFEANIRSFPNSPTETQALYGKFIYALYGVDDREAAQYLYNTLNARYPSSGHARIAEIQLEATPEVSAAVGRPSLGPGVSIASVPTPQLPREFSLDQNFPNPFNPTTTIKYSLPVDAHVSLKVYDMLGKEVATLVNESVRAGSHSAMLDGSDLASGLYLYRLSAAGFSEARKLLLVK